MADLLTSIAKTPDPEDKVFNFHYFQAQYAENISEASARQIFENAVRKSAPYRLINMARDVVGMGLGGAVNFFALQKMGQLHHAFAPPHTTMTEPGCMIIVVCGAACCLGFMRELATNITLNRNLKRQVEAPVPAPHATGHRLTFAFAAAEATQSPPDVFDALLPLPVIRRLRQHLKL